MTKRCVAETLVPHVVAFGQLHADLRRLCGGAPSRYFWHSRPRLTPRQEWTYRLPKPTFPQALTPHLSNSFILGGSCAPAPATGLRALPAFHPRYGRRPRSPACTCAGVLPCRRQYGLINTALFGHWAITRD